MTRRPRLPLLLAASVLALVGCSGSDPAGPAVPADDWGAVLAEAQRLGYAEPDPTADVEGIDAATRSPRVEFSPCRGSRSTTVSPHTLNSNVRAPQRRATSRAELAP